MDNHMYSAIDFNTILEKKFSENIEKYSDDIKYLKYNDLILEFDKIFEEKYFTETALDLLYDVYRKYSICNVVLYPLFSVYEKYRRKEERFSEFNIDKIEKSVYTTHSYIESYETVKNIIMEFNKKHVDFEENSLIGHIRGYSDKSVEESFFGFVSNFIKMYHLMYCALFDVTYRSTKRDIGLACGYIVQNYVKISDQEFLQILDWAETKIVFDGYTILSDALIENMRQIQLPLITEDNWIVNKEALALIFTYKKALMENGFGDATFPIDKMFMCAMTCNSLEEYKINTKTELKNVDYLPLDEVEKNIYKNVIVINNFFDIYEFGLDMPETFTKENTKMPEKSEFYNEYLKKEIENNNKNIDSQSVNNNKSNYNNASTINNKTEETNNTKGNDTIYIFVAIVLSIIAGIIGYNTLEGVDGAITGIIILWGILLFLGRA